MDLLNRKPLHEMTPAERAELEKHRTALREQILEAQRTNTNRDAAALRREREWLRKNRGQQ